MLAAAMILLAFAATAAPAERRVSLAMRDAEIAEVMEMLSRQEQLNILLAEDVGGSVSFNLYDVAVDEAIESIANAAGYAVERRGDFYFVLEHEEAGKYIASSLTLVRNFELQYADPQVLVSALTPYLSSYGNITSFSERRMLIIEDTPQFLTRIQHLLVDMDRQPRQILIEAKILEITLSDEESFGINWANFFSAGDGDGVFGQQGLAGAGSSGSTGFFLELTDPDITLLLNALEARGRVRTLSTPKLLALEGQEASVIVGDRRGYRVTTTINQVTSETIEFLESGVILRVTSHVDSEGRILMEAHPEVSTGTVDANGIPSQVTTEVTTQLLVPSGRTVFIGGLMKHTTSASRQGVPVLSSIPGIRRLFSNKEKANVSTETVVLITPYVIEDFDGAWNADPITKTDRAERELLREAAEIDANIDRFIDPPGQ